MKPAVELQVAILVGYSIISCTQSQYTVLVDAFEYHRNEGQTLFRLRNSIYYDAFDDGRASTRIKMEVLLSNNCLSHE